MTKCLDSPVSAFSDKIFVRFTVLVGVTKWCFCLNTLFLKKLHIWWKYSNPYFAPKNRQVPQTPLVLLFLWALKVASNLYPGLDRRSHPTPPKMITKSMHPEKPPPSASCFRINLGFTIISPKISSSIHLFFESDYFFTFSVAYTSCSLCCLHSLKMNLRSYSWYFLNLNFVMEYYLCSYPNMRQKYQANYSWTSPPYVKLALCFNFWASIAY